MAKVLWMNARSMQNSRQESEIKMGTSRGIRPGWPGSDLLIAYFSPMKNGKVVTRCVLDCSPFQVPKLILYAARLGAALAIGYMVKVLWWNARQMQNRRQDAEIEMGTSRETPPWPGSDLLEL
ncbi:hypothetical protein ACLOJK_038281 [Asimina triloba]